MIDRSYQVGDRCKAAGGDMKAKIIKIYENGDVRLLHNRYEFDVPKKVFEADYELTWVKN